MPLFSPFYTFCSFFELTDIWFYIVPGKVKRKYALIAAVILPINCLAGWFGADFSADAVQTSPQKQISKGKMYVGKGKVRTEISKDGLSMIEIIDPERKLALLLFPDKKVYMERSLPALNVALQEKDRGNPCATLQHASCKKLGKNQLNGRDSDQWEITINGKTVMQWNDSQHKFPVLRKIAGMVTLELVYVGKEEIGGRATEKWRSVMTGNDGSAIQSFQWYDPVLNIAIRHQMADGSVREMKNIIMGEQPASLFEVPDGYRKETMSATNSGR